MMINEDLEHLLIASETADPYGVIVIDPKSGVSKWSYKGSELQGAVIGNVNRVGADGNLFLVSIIDKPLLHTLTLNSQRRFHLKSVLHKPLEHMAITLDGTILFASFSTQIFVWMISGGELLNVFDAQYRRITGLVLNSDGTLLFTGAEDGSVNAFLVADILSVDSAGMEKIAPFAEWRPHSLAVSDMFVTLLPNARVVSCSKDHTAAIYSLTMRECLLKVSGDVAISACAMDPAECRLFLGTAKGPIAQVDLYTCSKSDLAVVFGTESSDILPLFTGHIAAVQRLAVNHDGSLLASGDASGNYIVWDILSRQCLRTSSTKGPICKLQFTINWIMPNDDDSSKWQTPRTAVLKRQKVDRHSIRIPLQSCATVVDLDQRCVKDLDEMIRDCVAKNVLPHLNESEQSVSRPMTKKSKKRRRRHEAQLKLNHEAQPIQVVKNPKKRQHELESEHNGEKLVKKERESTESVESLKAKIAELTAINREIYNFSATFIAGRK